MATASGCHGSARSSRRRRSPSRVAAARAVLRIRANAPAAAADPPRDPAWTTSGPRAGSGRRKRGQGNSSEHPVVGGKEPKASSSAVLHRSSVNSRPSPRRNLAGMQPLPCRTPELSTLDHPKLRAEHTEILLGAENASASATAVCARGDRDSGSPRAGSSARPPLGRQTQVSYLAPGPQSIILHGRRPPFSGSADPVRRGSPDPFGGGIPVPVGRGLPTRLAGLPTVSGFRPRRKSPTEGLPDGSAGAPRPNGYSSHVCAAFIEALFSV